MNAYNQDFDLGAVQEADFAGTAENAAPVGTYGTLSRWFDDQSLRTKIVGNTRNMLVLWGIAMVVGLYGLWNPEAQAVTRTAMLACTAMGFVVGILKTRSIVNNTVAPITVLARDMVRITKGARDIQIVGLNRHDEIGELARALKAFSEWGIEMDEIASERAHAAEERERSEQERLQAEEARKQGLLDIADQFESTVGDVAGSVASAASQLHSAATALEAAAKESAMQTEEVSKAMEQNTEGVTSVASASDEFALSISEISRQVALSAELARDASGTATSANQTISSLSDSANEIGTIVELIQSIAQRTNLLALNASIESARGGEAGRGFAVVAAEVKELAAQTSRATAQVSEQIRAIQDTTGESVTALQTIATKINQLEETAVSIASAVDQQSVAGQELARNIDMAARSTSEITDKLAKLREASMASGSAASQTLGSANELEAQASTLSAKSDDFLAHVRRF